MRTIIKISTIMALALLGLLFLTNSGLKHSLVAKDPKNNPESPANEVQTPATSSEKAVTGIQARRKMSEGERLEYLEQLGYMPEDGDANEWRLAERATWWGKRLNPAEFWKGKVVWKDKCAIQEANQHGRAYPPIPGNMTLGVFEKIDDADKTPSSFVIDGSARAYRWTERERAFWDRFSKTRPNPPDVIERAQIQSARTVLGTRQGFESLGNPSDAASTQLGRIEALALSDAVQMGYPKEAFTYEALFWTYVLNKRLEYQTSIQTNSTPVNQRIFWKTSYVNSNYITQPLTDAQIKESILWKIDYLRRLRKEKTDESYINAYLRVWNLTADQVFSPSSEKR